MGIGDGRAAGALVLDLIRLGALLHRELDRELKEHEADLTTQQLLFLEFLARHPGLTVPRLADYLAFTRQGLYPMVNRFEAKQLVTIDNHRDTSGLFTTMTDRGFRCLDEALETAARVEEDVVQVKHAVPRAWMVQTILEYLCRVENLQLNRAWAQLFR